MKTKVFAFKKTDKSRHTKASFSWSMNSYGSLNKDKAIIVHSKDEKFNETLFFVSSGSSIFPLNKEFNVDQLLQFLES